MKTNKNPRLVSILLLLAAFLKICAMLFLSIWVWIFLRFVVMGDPHALEIEKWTLTDWMFNAVYLLAAIIMALYHILTVHLDKMTVMLMDDTMKQTTIQNRHKSPLLRELAAMIEKYDDRYKPKKHG